jgi:hypothetical protein
VEGGQSCLRDIPLTKEFRMDMARLEIPVSGWTCLSTADDDASVRWNSTERDARITWISYLCRCSWSRSLSGSCSSSSSRPTARRLSSFQLPSSRWRVLYQLGPCHQWTASSRQLWQACWRRKSGVWVTRRGMREVGRWVVVVDV